MRVVGVDLSAEPARTAVAVLEWVDGKAAVEDLRFGADDEAVLAALMAADKAGIDAPLGWPDAFVAFLAAHQGNSVLVVMGRTANGRQDWKIQGPASVMATGKPRALIRPPDKDHCDSAGALHEGPVDASRERFTRGLG
jgi:hypothetical protein